MSSSLGLDLLESANNCSFEVWVEVGQVGAGQLALLIHPETLLVMEGGGRVQQITADYSRLQQITAAVEARQQSTADYSRVQQITAAVEARQPPPADHAAAPRYHPPACAESPAVSVRRR